MASPESERKKRNGIKKRKKFLQSTALLKKKKNSIIVSGFRIFIIEYRYQTEMVMKDGESRDELP